MKPPHLSLRNVTLAASGTILLAFALAGAAKAITDAKFIYSAARTGYLVIPPPAFTPRSLDINYLSSGGSISLIPTTTDGVYWTAPVNLPHGAKITDLALWFRKPTGDDFISLILYRMRLSTGEVSEIANHKPPATANAYKGVSYAIAGETIDNRSYGYFLFLTLRDADGTLPAPNFSAARVTYTYTSAGD